jgi:enoyl-CoA hydratase/carnithine racemase
MSVSVRTTDRIAVIRMLRPKRPNAADAATAKSPVDAFRTIDADHGLEVAMFTSYAGCLPIHSSIAR